MTKACLIDSIYDENIGVMSLSGIAVTPFSLSGLLGGISSILFGLLVFWKTQDKYLGKIWFYFSSFVAIWSFGVFWICGIKEEAYALFAWRVVYAFGANWIPVLFFHFVHVFLELPRNRSIATQYAIGGAFFLMAFSPWIYSESIWVFDSFYFAGAGPLYLPYSLWWLGSVVYSHWFLLKGYPGSTDEKKRQIKYFFLATAVGFGGGFFNFLPPLKIRIYPWGNFAILFYPMVMSYAILKHRLMGIRIVVRRIALLISVYGALLVLGLLALVVLHSHYFDAYPQLTKPLFIEVGLLSIILSAGPFLFAHIIRQSSYFREHEMAGLTHDLKSPLASIQSAMEVLGELKEGQELKARHEGYLDMIVRNAARLEKEIENLLTVFRLPTKIEPFVFHEKDLTALVEKKVRDSQDLAQAKGISLIFRDSPRGLNIRMDAAKIEQVFSNLLTNALKYTNRGSVTVSIEDEGSVVEVTVQDTGVGIPSNELPRVFDRFFQGATSRKSSGTGIGLTIAKTWIEAHGGEIHAESDGDGKGSRFCFTLPKN